MDTSYYAVIPARILHDKDMLKYPRAILLYGHISTLANQKGYCWASNKYFMEQLGVKSATTINDYLNLLVSKGYIQKKNLYKAGTKQIDKRVITVDCNTPMPVECNTPITPDCNPPMPVECKENNTSINTTRLNIKRNKKESSDDLSDGTSSAPVPYSEIIDYLNEKTGKSYKATSRNNQKLIKARWNEGYTVDDFKKVIDNKVSDWKDDTKMNKYLQPSTLFRASKFEGYLNEKPKQKASQGSWDDYYKANNWEDVW